MANVNLQGMGVALITPFLKNEDVDYEALIRMVDYLLDNGTDYIVALGTTAETITLSDDEKKKVTRVIVERVNSRIPIVLGIGGNCTHCSIAQINRTDLAGIDAILSVVPYYNKPTQEGLYQHFKAIAQVSPLPIVLYNVPSRTMTNMSAETTLRLAHELDSVIAIKEASGNFAQVGEIIKHKPTGFQVISGDDGVTFPLIAIGAAGVISVLGNAFPSEFSRMVHLALDGDYLKAREIHLRFNELIDLLFVDGSPAGIKSTLHLMGFVENKLRLPLVPARIVTYEKIRNVLLSLNVNIK